jgi:hypothetical protein
MSLLSQEQQEYLEKILSLDSSSFLFVTGSAGTGKSTLLKAVQDADSNTIILAPTGIAAIQARGQTIHSFFGLKPGSKFSRMRKESRQALANANRLIIDEISMVRSDLMQTINNIMQRELNNPNPFGGIPVIVFGDQFQIEPVVKEDENQYFLDNYGSHFFFDAPCVKSLKPIEIIKLNTIYRQKGEIEYIEALQSLRQGYIDKLDVFNSRIKPPHEDCVRITYTNKKSADINQTKLNQLDNPLYSSKASITGNFLEPDFPTAEKFIFKLGARVMFLVNNREPDNEYVNGDIGTIEEIQKDKIYVRLDRTHQLVYASKFKWEKISYTYTPGKGIESEITGTFTQLPLKLAWSLTTHKIQGQTFYNKVHLELETKSFAHGLLYVALSRATKLENLTINRRIYSDDIIIDERVANWCSEHNI